MLPLVVAQSRSRLGHAATCGNKWSALFGPGHDDRMASHPALDLHPDRLLPSDPGVRAVARELYDSVAELPIISPHGHVPAQWLAEDTPFADPTSLLITPDHYVNRLLHAHGVALSELGVGQGELDRAAVAGGVPGRLRALGRLPRHAGAVLVRRPAGRHLRRDGAAERRDRGRRSTTRSRSVSPRPSSGRARCTPGSASRCWPPPTTRATTCPRTSSCATTPPGPAGSSRPSAPTGISSRPRRPGTPTWTGWPRCPASTPATTPVSSPRWRTAAATSRTTAPCRPITATSTPAPTCWTTPRRSASTPWPAKRSVTDAEATALRRHLVSEMARMACEDGLVMTLHPGVRRNHHQPTFEQYGADVGTDIPVRVEFTDALRPMLNRYGTHPNFQLVIFTLDETVFSREIAPLAGFYPSVYAGAPWWFLDAPEAIRRYRSAVTESAGFGQDVRLHRRHPRLLLHPGPPRHVPPPRRRLRRPAGRRAPTRRGRGRSTPSTTSSSPTPERRSSYDRTTPPPTAVPCAAGHAADAPRCGSSTSGSATSTAPTRPGTPPTPPTPTSGASPPSPAGDPTWPPRLAPQDGLYTLITRSADGDTFELIGACRRSTPRPSTTSSWTTCADPRSRW